MTWKVGQTVGQEYGYTAKELRRSVVERVTRAGGALVNGHFYKPSGRPYMRYGTFIFAWTDAHELRWLEQECRRKLREAALKTRAARARRKREEDREAIDFGLELIKNRVDGPIVKRLSDLLRSIRPEEESTS